MDHAHALGVRGRELLLLPARRRDAPVGGVERHEKRRVHYAQAQDLLRVHREFRVEADVAALRAVEELAVQQHPRVGEDVLEEQRLAPADVREDQVGTESLALEVRRAGRHALSAVDRFHHRAIEGIELVDRGQVVAEHLDAGKPRLPQEVRLFADRHYAVAGVRRVMRRQVPVLAGKVLVDEEDAVHTGSRIARLRYEVTGASR